MLAIFAGPGSPLPQEVHSAEACDCSTSNHSSASGSTDDVARSHADMHLHVREADDDTPQYAHSLNPSQTI